MSIHIKLVSSRVFSNWLPGPESIYIYIYMKVKSRAPESSKSVLMVQIKTMGFARPSDLSQKLAQTNRRKREQIWRRIERKGILG